MDEGTERIRRAVKGGEELFNCRRLRGTNSEGEHGTKFGAE